MSSSDMLLYVELLEILKFGVEYNDLELVTEVVSVIGEVHSMFGDLKSAICSFNCAVSCGKNILLL